MTSSAISRMPFFEQISRTPGMKLSCGGITPPAPRIGFHDEGGDGAGTLKGDFIRQGLQAELGEAFGIGFIERVAIGVGRRDVVAAGQQRFVLGAEIGVAVDRGAAHMGAVVAFFQAQELGAARLSTHLVVLARQAQAVSTESDPPEV